MNNGSYSELMTQLAMSGHKQTHNACTEQTKTFHWGERVYRPATSKRGAKS